MSGALLFMLLFSLLILVALLILAWITVGRER